MDRLFGILGIVFILLIAYLMSNNRKKINFKTVGIGFLLQVSLAVFIFKVPLGQKMFLGIGVLIQKILDFAFQGGQFVFGGLLDFKLFDSVFGAGHRIFVSIGRMKGLYAHLKARKRTRRGGPAMCGLSF